MAFWELILVSWAWWINGDYSGFYDALNVLWCTLITQWNDFHTIAKFSCACPHCVSAWDDLLFVYKCLDLHGWWYFLRHLMMVCRHFWRCYQRPMLDPTNKSCWILLWFTVLFFECARFSWFDILLLGPLWLDLDGLKSRTWLAVSLWSKMYSD